jgi:hypothetical protein
MGSSAFSGNITIRVKNILFYERKTQVAPFLNMAFSFIFYFIGAKEYQVWLEVRD